MSDIERLFSTLHETVLMQLRARAGFKNVQIAFEFGTPIPADTFLLQDAGRTVSPTLAVEFMSLHADALPEIVDNFFRRRSLTVEGQYMILLVGSMPSSPGEPDLLGAVKRKATRDFENVSGSLSGDYVYRPIVATPVNWYDPAAKENWTSIRIDSSDSLPKQGKPPKFNPELLKWHRANASVMPLLKKPASSSVLSNFAAQGAAKRLQPAPAGTHLLTQKAKLHEPVLAASIKPARSSAIRIGAMAATTAPTPIPSKQSQTLGANVLHSTAKLHSPRARPFPAWTGSELLDESKSSDITGDHIAISFDLCLVQLRRPWLSDGFLALNNWYVPGYEKGSFSAGDGKSGHMAMLPTGCILIRDLHIRAKWTASDLSEMQRSSALGGFSLLGQTFDGTTASLRVPGMQSIGWICEAMPILPPSPP